MMLHYMKSIYESLCYNKFRTFLTGVGILIGIASLVIILTVSKSFEKNLLEEVTGSSVSIGLSCDTIVSGDLNSIMNYPEVRLSIDEAKLIEGVKLLVQDEGNNLINYSYNGISENGVEYEFNNYVSVDEGEGFLERIGNVVIIRSSDEYENEVEIGKSIIIDGIVYEVIGYTSEFGKNTFPILYFPEALQEIIAPNEYEETSTFELYVMDNYDTKVVAKNVIDKLNENIPKGYKFINYSEDINASVETAIDSIAMFISLIAGISLIVAAINVANIMYISILERKGEVAIYRALGMKKGEVRTLFLIESIVIVFIFSILGYIVGIFVAYIITVVLRIKFIIDFNNILVTIILSVLVGIASGYRPAKIASEANTADILR